MIRGDWKSLAADRLHQMGLHDQARALYGINEKEGKVVARTRRTAKRTTSSTTFLGRLKHWLLP